MLKLLLKSLAAGLTLGAVMVMVPETAHSQIEPKSVGVGGRSSWAETGEAIDRLAAMGIPIHRNCSGVDRCIMITHYYEQTSTAGKTVHALGDYGRAHIYLNNYRERGYPYRMALLFHEFGHALGDLDHNPGCESSMKTPLGKCGTYVIGYSPEEQMRLREIWG